MERTFAMLKPDAVQLRHIGAIIEICEQQGFRLLALKMLQLDDKQAHMLYQEHTGRPYFDNLIAFSMSGPVVICVFEGFQAMNGSATLSVIPIPCKLPATLYALDSAQVCRIMLSMPLTPLSQQIGKSPCSLTKATSITQLHTEFVCWAAWNAAAERQVILLR